MTKNDGTHVTRRLTMFPSPDYPAFHTSMPVVVYHGRKRKVLDIPVYGSAILDELLCSKYVRLAASDLFGKSYSISPAWDRHYNDSLVYEFRGLSLEELALRKVLKPGMVIGVHNPGSSHNKDLDMQGNPVKYTHNALYLGTNKFGEPLVAEQFINAINVRTEKDMRRDKLTPIEIIDAKKGRGVV